MNVDVPRMEYEYEIDTPTNEITIYKNTTSGKECTRSVFVSKHVDDFVEDVFNGLDNRKYHLDLKYNDYVAYAAYCNQIVNNVPLLAQKMQFLDSKKEVSLENLYEKREFIGYYNMFKQTSLYTFLKVMFGLATAGVIIMIVHAISKILWPGGEKKQVVNVILPNVEEPVEMTYRYQIIKNLDDNVDDLVASLWCTLIDYDHDEMGWGGVKAAVKDAIRYHVIPRHDELKNIPINLEQVIYQSSKTTKRIEEKPIRSHKIEQIQGQSKTTLYGGNRKAMKEVKVQTSNVQQVHSNVDVRSVIEKNLCVVTTKVNGETRTMHGIDIGNGVVLTMFHQLCFLNDAKKYEEINAPAVSTATYLIGGQTYALEIALKDQFHDIVVFKVNDKQYQPRRKIANYFVKENSSISSLCEFVRYPKPFDGVFTRTVALGTVSPVDVVRETQNMRKGAKVYATSLLETNNILSQRGDCGLPLYSANESHETILGLHYGITGGYLMSVRITQEYLLQNILPAIATCQSSLNDEDYEENEEWYECTELEYEAFGQMEHVVIDNESLKIIKQADLSSQSTFECLEKGEHTEPFGYTYTGCRADRLKPKYVPTPWTDEVHKIIPREESNSATCNRKVVDPSDLPCDRIGRHSILIGQQNKLNDPQSAQGQIIGSKYMKKATEMLIPWYENLYGKYKHRYLSDLEVINGTYINPRCPFYGQLEPIDRTGSIGTDITSKFKINHKQQVLRLTDLQVAGGRDIWNFKDTPAAKYIIAQQLATFDYWSRDIRCESLAQSNLKCELRPNAKVEKGKTRCFESFTFANSNTTRKVLGTIFAAIKMERAKGFAQVGIDTVNFDELYRRFLRIGNFGEAGDFSAWDKHLMEEAILQCGEIWTKVFMHQHEPSLETAQREIEVRNLIHQILVSNYKAIIIADGNIFTKNRGNCSGSQTTTHLNGTVNDIYRLAIILYLIDQHNMRFITSDSPVDFRIQYAEMTDQLPTINFHDFGRIECNSMRDVLTITDWINYGDDICSVINDKYAYLINFVTLKRAYKHLFGIEYDAPTKDGVENIRTHLTDLSFISRTFHLDSLMGKITPRLKLSSVNRLLHWTTSLTNSQFKTNMDEVFDELKFYDEETYRKYALIVRVLINPYLQRNYNDFYLTPSWVSMRQTYEDKVSNLTNLQATTIAAAARNNENVGKPLTFDDLFTNNNMEFQGDSVTQCNLSLELAKMIPTNLALKTEVETILAKLPEDYELKFSGNPAIIADYHGKCWWSCSLIPTHHKSLEDFSLELEIAFLNCDHLNVVDIVEVFIYIPQCERRIQIRLQPCRVQDKSLRKELILHEPPSLETEVQMENSAAAVDPLPQITAGPPIPIQDSGIPIELYQMGFGLKSTKDLSEQFMPKANYRIENGSSTGKVIFNLTRNDLINEYMLAAKTGDSEFAGSFEVKVVMQTNPGLTGTLMLGMTKTHMDSPTEQDLQQKKTFHIDGTIGTNVTMRIYPFATGLTVPTRFTWPPIAEEDKFFPSIVLIVVMDFVSTYDNMKLFSQIRLYTRFAEDVRTFYNGSKALGSNKDVKTKLTLGDTIDAEEVVGSDVRLFTDGAFYSNTVMAFVPESMNIQINDFITKTRSPGGVWGDTIEWEFEHHAVGYFHTGGNISPLSYEATKKFKEIVNWKVSNNEPAEHKVEIIENDLNHRLASGYITTRDDYIELEMDTTAISYIASRFKYDHQKHENESVAINNFGTSTLYMVPTYKEQHILNTLDTKLFTFRVTPEGEYHNIAIEYKDAESNSTHYIANAAAGHYPPISQSLWQFSSIINQNLHIPFDPRKIMKANSMKSSKTTTLPSGGSSLQALKVPYIVPTPSEGAVLAGNCTMWSSVSLYDRLSTILGDDNIYLIACATKNYNQTIFEFIYHGPQKTVFIFTKNTQYLLCTHLSQDLRFRIVSTIAKNGSLPVTSLDKTAMADRRANTTRDIQCPPITKFMQTRVPPLPKIHIQGNLYGIMAGGALAGVGTGLGSYYAGEQQFGHSKELMQLKQKGDAEQLQQYIAGLSEKERAAIQAQLEASKELYTHQFETQQKSRNLQTSAMQVQHSDANLRAGNDRRGVGAAVPLEYNTQKSTVLETQFPSFNLETGAKNPAMSKPLAPGVNHPLRGPIADLATGLKGVNDDVEFQKNVIPIDTLSASNGATPIPPEVISPTAHASNVALTGRGRNSHGLGAEPGTKVKDLSFPSMSPS
uniref:Peptidase C3 domain-containing protein n=1 Tax=Riboviria sp. TaxID=2585031 RepID=A0A6M9Z913_9VIRU|nr:MAG: hypothetical protein [Riboviria sp.]